MVYSTGRFTICCFVIVFLGPFVHSDCLAWNGFVEVCVLEAAADGAFHAFVRFALVWFVCFLPLGVWEGLWLVTVLLPGLFSSVSDY